jgi:GxxExxY protein
MKENQLGSAIIEAAIDVNRHLGPGLLETVYEAVLARELTVRGLSVKRQVPVPIEYKGVQFNDSHFAQINLSHRILVERS